MRDLKNYSRICVSVVTEFPKNDPHSVDLILPFVSLDPVQTLASDFGFEDSFNHSLKVEEKKNHQNRIAPPRQHPPVPPLPPRKASYVPSNLPPVPPVAKERAVPIQANTFTPNAKPECVHYLWHCHANLSKIVLVLNNKYITFQGFHIKVWQYG